LRQAFVRAGVKVDAPDDIQAAMWEKLVFIASISGVGAVTRAPIGITRSIPELRRMLEQAMHELVSVGRARKVNLAQDTVSKTMATVDGLPGGVMASMQRDIIEGRPSELDAQNGAVVRMGMQAGVPTPVHAFLYYSLLPQEQRARGEIQF
jgi:2-dehydropantoate 2-reductase